MKKNSRHQWQSLIGSTWRNVDVCRKCGVYRWRDLDEEWSYGTAKTEERIWAAPEEGLKTRPACIDKVVHIHDWGFSYGAPQLKCRHCGVERLESNLLEGMVWTGFRAAGEAEWRRVYLPCTKKGK